MEVVDSIVPDIRSTQTLIHWQRFPASFYSRLDQLKMVHSIYNAKVKRSSKRIEQACSE